MSELERIIKENQSLKEQLAGYQVSFELLNKENQSLIFQMAVMLKRWERIKEITQPGLDGSPPEAGYDIAITNTPLAAKELQVRVERMEKVIEYAYNMLKQEQNHTCVLAACELRKALTTTNCTNSKSHLSNMVIWPILRVCLTLQSLKTLTNPTE